MSSASSSPSLDAALADIDTVFNGFASPAETGCEQCFRPEETAYLRTPYTRVPADLVRRFFFKIPGHFEDHAAVMRRLLPQAAHAMAEGTLDGIGWGHPGLSRVEWRAWPAHQAAAVETFVHDWWQHVLRVPEPPYPVADVFETCAMILGTVTPLLDRWDSRPTADVHLASCSATWLYQLEFDAAPFGWWDPDDEVAVVAELQSWLAGHAPARLRAQHEPDLATRAELLALPYGERWAHPYRTSPSVTN